MPNIISRDTPLAEITLRRYEKPSSSMSQRELIRKLCLSFGLLQPGDSRDIIVDIFLVLYNSKKELTANEVEQEVIAYRKANKLALKGIAGSNVRRQIRRLKAMFLIEKVVNKYRVLENLSLTEIFEEKIEQYFLKNIVSRVKEYLKELDSRSQEKR